jgi:hypothetical protein
MRTRKDKWIGVLSSGAKRSLTEDYVRSNFKRLFRMSCKRSKGVALPIPAGAPRAVPFQDFSPRADAPIVYQQLTRETCVFSALASAFRYFNDNLAREVVASHILESETVQDRFQYVFDLFNGHSALKKYRLVKYKNRMFNILMDVSCWPTVVRLAATDEAINHAVVVAGNWLFDANLATAHQLSLPLLNWCCSSTATSSKFSHVAYAIRFKFNSKTREEWQLCNGCRSNNKCMHSFI